MINNMPDKAISEEIGRRIARYRLNRNMTQAELARNAGVSLPTVSRLENGQGGQTENLWRILRVLGLLDNLDMLIPAPPESPVQKAERLGKMRKRAQKPRKNMNKQSDAWSWEDDT